jgi:transcriptional regulator with XRE-family HTH domain/Zn-dependent peptidase ImmA (M78 family)
MDKVALGLRLAQARELAGMTQEGLGRAVKLDRTAITRLEKGERKLNVTELVEIASALRRPLSYFVDAPLPAVVSRRQDTAHAHATTHALDDELNQFSRDVRTLLDMGLLSPVDRAHDLRAPQDHEAAEALAAASRRHLGIGNEPVDDLGQVCERLGLYTFSVLLGNGGPDGGCVQVSDDASATLGAAVVNGDAPPGRRRMTLAHELGHWLAGDAYDAEASVDSERMIFSFAIHFLAPRAGLRKVWNEHPDWDLRDRALAVGASFRLSWSAVLGQLRNVNIIDQMDYRRLADDEPRRGDFLRLRLRWVDELSGPYVSPGFASASVNGYVSGRLTAARAVELLRGTLEIDDLPRQDALSVEDLRRSFAGHDG